MSYSKKTWVTGETVTSSALNNMENGIAANDEAIAEINEDITGIDGHLDVLDEYVEASFVQEEITNAPIASFDDGADGVPVKSLIISVDPVQDLHGQDNPYPAGGGKNKFDGIVEQGGLNAADGSESVSDARIRCDYISVEPSTGYDFSCNSEIRVYYVFFYDEDKTFISSSLANASNYTFTTPATAKYLRVTFNKPQSDTITPSDLIWGQLELGSSATNYAPYENICPITGWTEANVLHGSKNLTPSTVTVGLNVDSDGTENNNTSASTSKYIPVVAGQQYTFSVNTNITGVRIEFYNAEKEFVSRTGTVNKVHTFTPASNVRYIRWTLNYNGTAMATTQEIVNSLKPQLEFGSIRTDFEDYNTTYEISFPDGAGTVYGAKLDPIKGKLRVTWVDKLLQASTIGPMSYMAGYARAYLGDQLSEYPAISATLTDFLCDTIKANNIYSKSENGIYIHGQTGLAISVSFDAIDGYSDIGDNSNYRNAIVKFLTDNNVHVCYPIATPVEYDLTPIEVKTLLGYNNIFADCGNIDELTYYRLNDTDTKISGVKSMLATEESSTTASKAYSVNEFLILNGTFYKVTANIANGGTITVGTNVTATTIGAVLTALLNA